MPKSVFRAGTGLSRARDSHLAGQEAARAAVGELCGEAPEVALVFTTPRHDLPSLLAGLKSELCGAKLVGATSSGEIVNGEYLGFGEGVAVLAMTRGPYRFGVASKERIRGDLDGAGQEVARVARARAGASTHGAALLFADSLLGDLQRLLEGVYRITGPRVTIAGGAAGDEQKFVRSVVFHDDEIVEEGAVALWIASERPLGVETRHGFRPIGLPLLVTRAEGTTIFELGGRSAAEVYEEQLGLPPQSLRVEDFWGTSILHPFGLLQPDGSMVIRVARSKTVDGHLVIQGCLPPSGCAVQVMSGSADELLGVVEEVVKATLAPHPEAQVLLTFSCAARATIYGSRASEEPKRLQAAAGKVPIFGFCCCAEFARTSGVLGTHNATLTAIAL